MCLMPKPPKPPTPPPAPAVYQTSMQEVIDPAALDAKNREKRRRQAAMGQPSTILAGAGSAPTTSAKTALGA